MGNNPTAAKIKENQMENTVMTALISLIKEGGYLALWGIFLFQFLIIVKFAVIGLFVLITVGKICDVNRPGK